MWNISDVVLRCSALGRREFRGAAVISWPKPLILLCSLVFPPQSPHTQLWFSWEWREFVCWDILGSLRAAFPWAQLHELTLSLPHVCDPAVPHTRPDPERFPCSTQPCFPSQAWLCPSKLDMRNITWWLYNLQGMKKTTQEIRASVWSACSWWRGSGDGGLQMDLVINSLCVKYSLILWKVPALEYLLCSRIKDIV